MSLVDALARAKKQFDDKKTADYLKRTVPAATLGIAGGMTPGFEILSGASTPPVYREPEPAPELPKMGLLSEFGHSLARVPSQAVSQIADMAAFVTGSKGLHEFSEISQQLGRKDFPSDAPQLSSMDELSNASLGDLARYGVAESGQAIASIGSMMIPGAVAKTVAMPVVKALVGYSPKVAKLVATMGGADVAATAIAGYAGNTLLESGSISADTLQKTGEMPDRLRVAVPAMIAAALETIPEIRLYAGLKRVAPELAREAAGYTGQKLVAFLVGAAKNMGIEGGTEFAQTLIEEAGSDFAGGMGAIESVKKTLSDPDAWARAGAAGIAGAAGGGLMGGMTDTANLFLKKEINQTDPVEPTAAGPNTDITIPEPVKATQAPTTAPTPEPAATMPTTEPDTELLGAVAKAKQLTQKSDIGENDHPVQAGAKKMIRKINDTLAGIGITGDMVNQFASEVGGAELTAMELPQLQQVYQAALSIAAQGNAVAPIPMEAPPAPVQQAPQPQMMPPVMPAAQPPVMPPVQRDNIEQAMMAAQQQAQIRQQQPAALVMPQPVRQPIPQTQAVTQPVMEPNVLPDEELSLEEQLEQAKKDLEAAQYSPVKAGGVPIMDARKEKYKRDLQDKIKYLEAEIQKQTEPKVTQPQDNVTLQPESSIAPQAPEPVSVRQRLTAAIDEFDNTSDYKPDEAFKVFNNRLRKARTKVRKILSKEGKLTLGLDTMLSQARDFRKLRFLVENADLEGPKSIKIPEQEPVTSFDKYYKAYSEWQGFSVPAKEDARNTLESFADTAIDKGQFSGTMQEVSLLRHAALKEILAGRGYKVSDPQPQPDGKYIAYVTMEEGTRKIQNTLDKIKEQEQAIPDIAPAPAPAPEPTPAPAPAGYGESNTVVTKDRYEELKKKFAAKTKNITSGVDPELLAITTEMAVYHLEAGVRKFSEFTKTIIADVGESFRPYLASAYLGAKYYPGSEKYRADMDSEAEVNKQTAEPTPSPTAEPTPAEPVPATEPTPAEPEIVTRAKALVPAVESLLTADKAMTNPQLEKALSDAGIDPKDHKLTQEAFEGAITMVIRKKNLYGDYYRLKKLYDNMPNLNERTGGSMKRQAYSTPHILTGLLTQALDLPTTDSLTIYEPTAGNGLLLSGVVENEAGTKNTYFLNELDSDRNSMLQTLFPDAKITNQDATTFAGPDMKVDVVFANPPFGSMPAKTITAMQGVKTEIDLSKIEHYIAWKALENLRPNGRAVIILGAEKENKISESGRVRFTKAMYNQFNITGHFEIDGQFYRKMGAEWPVEIYIIEGKKDFPTNREMISPPKSVRRIEYAEGWNGIRDYIRDSIKTGQYINRPDIADRGRGQRDNTGKPQGNVEINAGQRSETRPEQESRPGVRPEPVSAEPAIRTDQQPVGDLTGDNGKRRDSERIERVKQSLATEGEKRPEQPRGPTTPDSAKPGADDTRIKSDELGVADSLQTPYSPVSENRSISSLSPKNLAAPTRKALTNILEESNEKSLDDYVAKQLGYDGKSDIPFLAAEQVDALAQTFRSFNRGGGNIVADQTGLGKGRVGAAAIQWAVQNGKIPVFITEKVGLFNDIYRDLRDIGQGALRPFMFNANGVMSYENSDGETVVAYEHDSKIYDKVFKKMLMGDYSDFTGPNRKFDFIALTYSQINKGDDSRKKTPILKQDAFRLAKNLVCICDEAHVAAGAAGSVSKETGGDKKGRDKERSNQMQNALNLIDKERTDAVLYMSATWAKTPENVPLYYRAFDQANLSLDEIATAFKRGDLAMQELVVASMANKGTYIRREQSYAGIDWIQERTPEKTERADAEKSIADRAMAEVRELIRLDGDVSKELSGLNIAEIIDTFGIDIPEEFIGGDTESGSRVASSLDSPGSPFSGVHNYINAFLAAVKADKAAERAIEMIRAGQKPVVSIQNTMESHMDTLLETGKGTIGEAFGGSYADILEANIEKLFTVTVKHPTKEKETFTFRIPLEALSPETVDKVMTFKERLKKADLSELPFSPIDYVTAKIKAAGFAVGEITGRGKYLDYSDTVNGDPILKVRPGKDITNKGKRATLNAFNSGELDVLILNSSGATGLSAHSSKAFKDQRQRTMVILQPFDDINVFTQMLGRIHRTGAVYNEKDVTSRIEGKPAKYGKPIYEYIQSSLGMEERPAARLQAKMKSLNANTSSSKESRQKISDVDVANKYGTKVIRNWLENNKNYAFELGYPEQSDINNATASQVTGRIAILPQQVQNSFWSEVIPEYNNLIDELNAIGANDLVLTSYDEADAVTVSKSLVYGTEGDPDNPPVYAELIEMTEPGNPTSYDVAVNRGRVGSTPTQTEIDKRDEVFKRFIEFKKKETAEFEARTGKPSGMNFGRMESYAEEVKKLITAYSPGTTIRGKVLTQKDVDGTSVTTEYFGVVSDVKLGSIPDGFIGNPWIPSKIKITFSAPTESGKVILPINKMVNFNKISDYELRYFKEQWQEEFKKNSTKRVRKMALTGDLIKSSTMSENSEVVQIQRRGGNREFMWLSTTDNGIMEVTRPVEIITDFSNPPAYMVSTDPDQDIQIANWEPQRYGQPKKDWSPSDTADEYDIRIAYSSPYRNMIVQNNEISKALDPVKSDPFVKEKLGRSSFMVLKEKISKSKIIPVLKKIGELLGARSGGLTDATAEGRAVDINFRKGSSDLLNALVGWVDTEVFPALESAFNFLARGGGSFLDWVGTLSQKFRNVAAKAWKKAQEILKIPSLNRRGGIITLSQAIKAAKEQIAKAPQPQAGEPAISKPAAKSVVTEAAKESFKAGVAEGKVRSDKRAARLKESATERYSKLQDKLNRLKKINQMNRLVRTQGKKFLIDLANRLPVAERASLIRAIANADTVLAQADVINRIDKLISKVIRRTAAKRFQQALRDARKLRPEFQALADELKKDIVARGHVIEAFDAMNKYLLDNPAAIVAEERVDTIKRLLAERGKTISPATMDMFSELLETITFLSNQENERVFANNAMTAAQNADKIISHVEKQPDISSIDESWAKWFFNIGSLQFEAIANMMGDAGRELFYGDMRRGERKAKGIWFAGRDEIRDEMKRIGLDPDDLKTAEWLDQDVGGMTRNERMNLVANLLDKSTREEIIRGGYKLKAAKKDDPAVMITEKDADNLIASLDKKEAAMVKTMRRFLNTTLKAAVNDSWVQLAGYEKALADDYWPRTRDIKQTGLNEGYRKWANNALESLGIFKQRERSKAAVMIGGVMETYQNHLKKASTFAGLAIPIRNTEIVLGKISDKIESRYGKKFLDRVKEQLSAMADLGNPTGGEMNAGAAAVLHRVSVSLLGGNIRAAAKQFGGLFTASTEISPALLSQSIGDAFDEDTRREMMENSPILRDRYDSSGARLVSPTFDSGEDLVKTSRTDYYRRLLMLPLEKCDQAVSQIIWSAAKKEQKAKGLKGQELIAATAERAEQIVSRTQNVTSVLDMSGVALEGRKSVWWKVMTLFQSQGNSIYNILRRGIENYRTGKIDSAQLMGVVSLALAGNAVWSMVIGNLVTLRGWGDDDDEPEEKKRARMISEITFDLLQENAGIFYGGSLFGAPFLRQAKKIVNKELIGLKETRVQAGSARVENAMESVANSGLQAAEHFLSASLTAGQKIKSGPNKGKFKSEVELKRGVWKATRLAASMTGIPMILLNEGSNLLYNK
jgi:hypothetical protein